MEVEVGCEGEGQCKVGDQVWRTTWPWPLGQVCAGLHPAMLKLPRRVCRGDGRSERELPCGPCRHRGMLGRPIGSFVTAAGTCRCPGLCAERGLPLRARLSACIVSCQSW